MERILSQYGAEFYLFLLNLIVEFSLVVIIILFPYGKLSLKVDSLPDHLLSDIFQEEIFVDHKICNVNQKEHKNINKPEIIVHYDLIVLFGGIEIEIRIDNKSCGRSSRAESCEAEGQKSEHKSHRLTDRYKLNGFLSPFIQVISQRINSGHQMRKIHPHCPVWQNYRHGNADKRTHNDI